MKDIIQYEALQRLTRTRFHLMKNIKRDKTADMVNISLANTLSVIQYLEFRCSVGLPVQGIALIAEIDRILDMARTAVNVVDDLTATAIVAATEGERLSPDLTARLFPVKRVKNTPRRRPGGILIINEKLKPCRIAG